MLGDDFRALLNLFVIDLHYHILRLARMSVLRTKRNLYRCRFRDTCNSTASRTPRILGAPLQSLPPDHMNRSFSLSVSCLECCTLEHLSALASDRRVSAKSKNLTTLTLNRDNTA